MALSQALRATIPIMGIIIEIGKNMEINIECKPTVHCKVFEDNSGAIEMTRVPKMRLRTKHINVNYHHFREFVRNGMVS